MSESRMLQRMIRFLPALTGVFTAGAALLALELLIDADWINAYLVPPPSAVLLSFARVIAEEHIAERFLLTSAEALGTGLLLAVVGIPLGLLLFRLPLLRRATETWVAAFASAPLVLAYPLFLVMFGRSALTIVMIGFFAGLAPVVLKTLEGLTGVRSVLIDVSRSFRPSATTFPAPMPRSALRCSSAWCSLPHWSASSDGTVRSARAPRLERDAI
jgi:NitT/TauT family transport system permease protein